MRHKTNLSVLTRIILDFPGNTINTAEISVHTFLPPMASNIIKTALMVEEGT